MNRNNHSSTQDEISFITEQLNKPLVIVGMMGVGKSYIGKNLAQALNLKFIDTDDLIEKKSGYSIAEIFQKFGEEKFRLTEARTIQELLEGDPIVISTGGGALINPQTREAVQEKSVSIWLRAEKDELVKRLKSSRNRPLLKDGNLEDIIGQLMAERTAYYEQSNISVDVVPKSVPQTLAAVIKALSAHYKKG
ncbi:MAG: shikimate kinase [Alphaproteobacteria bacterium]